MRRKTQNVYLSLKSSGKIEEKCSQVFRYENVGNSNQWVFENLNKTKTDRDNRN